MIGGDPISVLLRSFQPADAEVCRQLYVDGLIGPALAENDTGVDIDDIQAAYMDHPGNHFWVAEHPDLHQVIGMVGLLIHEDGTAEIRRLRVHVDYRRRGVGSSLLETALKHCSDNGYLKVALDTYVDRDPAVQLFEKFRFKLSRTKSSAGRDLLYFYLDLYTGDRSSKNEA